MIDKRDIALYRKAKKERWVIDVLTALASLCLLVLMGFEANNRHEYSTILALSSMLLFWSAMGGSRWVATSREDLLKAMARMINRDAEALKIIADSRQDKHKNSI